MDNFTFTFIIISSSLKLFHLCYGLLKTVFWFEVAYALHNVFILGNKTWGFLHTMAAYYPDKPTPEERADMTNFFTTFSKFYPCSACAKDFQEQ
jgi:hypothetical protein